MGACCRFRFLFICFPKARPKSVADFQRSQALESHPIHVFAGFAGKNPSQPQVETLAAARPWFACRWLHPPMFEAQRSGFKHSFFWRFLWQN